MSKKIYGVPITTPLNPKKFGPAAVYVGTGEMPDGYTFQIDPEGENPLDAYVKSVNGVAPDENGNVEVAGGSGGSGEDGFSPIANVNQTANGAVVTITDKTGTTTATITNGKDGKDGKDAVSLIVTILWNKNTSVGTASHSPSEVYDAVKNGIPVSAVCFLTDNSTFLGQFDLVESTAISYRLSMLFGIERVTLIVRSDKSVIMERSYFLKNPDYAEIGRILSISGVDDYGVVTALSSVSLDAVTPVRGKDYWTPDDIAEIKSYVDDAILGGAW